MAIINIAVDFDERKARISGRPGSNTEIEYELEQPVVSVRKEATEYAKTIGYLQENSRFRVLGTEYWKTEEYYKIRFGTR